MTTTPRRADATATASDEGWRSRLLSAGAAASAVPPMLHVLTAAGDAEVHTVGGVHELRIPTRTAAGERPWHAS